jgi:hypothetical protein
MEIIGNICDMALIKRLDDIQTKVIRSAVSRGRIKNPCDTRVIVTQDIEEPDFKDFSKRLHLDINDLRRNYGTREAWLFNSDQLYSRDHDLILRTLEHQVENWRDYVSTYRRVVQVGGTACDLIGWHNDQHVRHCGMKNIFICTGNPDQRVLMSGPKKSIQLLIPQPGDIISFNIGKTHALAPSVGHSKPRAAEHMARFITVYGMCKGYYKWITPRQ